jgi:hypothetical protein
MKPHHSHALVALVVIALFAVALYIGFAAPCEWFAASPATDIPARCLKGYVP